MYSTVEVRGELGQLRAAVLTLPLEPGEAGLLPDTVEVFRFDEDAQAYHRVDPGGVLDGTVAWARVAGPGRYVAAGLPADPLVLRTVTVMHEATCCGWRRARSGPASRSGSASSSCACRTSPSEVLRRSPSGRSSRG